MNRLALALATFFGCGYFPKAPGTIGSLAGILVAALLCRFGLGQLALAVLLLICLLPAIWSATVTARLLNRKDPSQVVIDEVLGQWVTLLGAGVWNWKTFLAAFLLFRLFDIWKPQPVRALEKLREGTGIVADDLMAGVYGALILYVGVHLRIV